MCRVFFFQAEDGIRDLVRSRGLGDVYKRQATDGGIDVGDLLFVKPFRQRNGVFRIAGGGVDQELSLIHI